jgi:hypothetical protein
MLNLMISGCDPERTCGGGPAVKGDLSNLIRMHLRYSDGPIK